MRIAVVRELLERFKQNSGQWRADEFNAAWDQLHAAAAPEHKAENVGTGLMDEVHCACGWKSKGYWDGAAYAWSDWQEHLEAVLTALDQPNPTNMGCQ